MGFADVAAVRRRVGKAGEYWSDGNSVDESDVAQFIEEVSSEIDAELGGQGYPPPYDVDVSKALEGLTASGAALRALRATFPTAESRRHVTELLDGLEAEWVGGLEAIRSGDHSVVALLGRQTSMNEGASSFWTEDADSYMLPWSYVGRPFSIVPTIYRGMRG